VSFKLLRSLRKPSRSEDALLASELAALAMPSLPQLNASFALSFGLEKSGREPAVPVVLVFTIASMRRSPRLLSYALKGFHCDNRRQADKFHQQSRWLILACL
jgi:hypothetical protein